jgi:DNA-binding XRE family transcriptional regulator
MEKKNSTGFRDYYMDDKNVSPADRAKIEFEIEFIGKLIEVREAKGLTQEQLAEAAGVKQSAIARLENLKSTPQIDTLFKILTPM